MNRHHCSGVVSQADRVAPLVGAHRELPDAGIIHQHVDPAELHQRCCRHLRKKESSCARSEVTVFTTPGEPAEHASNSSSPAPLRSTAVTLCPSQQCQGHREADSARRAGDNHGFVVHVIAAPSRCRSARLCACSGRCPAAQVLEQQVARINRHRRMANPGLVRRSGGSQASSGIEIRDRRLSFVHSHGASLRPASQCYFECWSAMGVLQIAPRTRPNTASFSCRSIFGPPSGPLRFGYKAPNSALPDIRRGPCSFGCIGGGMLSFEIWRSSATGEAVVRFHACVGLIGTGELSGTISGNMARPPHWVAS